MKNLLVSKITSKYQITIPKEIRDTLKLSDSDLVQWTIDKDGIRLESVEKPFLKYKGFLGNQKIASKNEIKKAWAKKF
jgi:AbrB family looped-hinge helix DNA binding protein